jgi:WD40 repeat protein
MLLLLLPALRATQTAAGAANKHTQTSSGNCSPNLISSGSGRVTVQFIGSCNGLDARLVRELTQSMQMFLAQFPKTIGHLNELLDKKDIELTEKVREVEDWTRRYSELSQQLEKQPADDKLHRQARDALMEGSLGRAEALIKARQLADQARGLIDETVSSLDLSALLSIESMRRYPLKESDYNLRRIIPFLGKPPQFSLVNPTHVGVIKASPDGRIVNFDGSNISILDPLGRLKFEQLRDQLRKQLDELAGPSALAAVSSFSTRTSARRPEALVFGADGRYLATSTLDGTIRLFDDTGNPIRDIPSQVSNSPLLRCLGGRYAASVAANTTVGVLEQTGGKPGLSITGGAEAGIRAFTPDGHYVALGNKGGAVRVFRIADDKALFTFTVPGELRAIDVSPDGRYVAGTSWTSTRVFDVSSKVEMRPLELELGKLRVARLLFNPRRNVVAVVDAVGGVRILEIDSGRTELDLGLVPLLPPQTMFVRSSLITFSSDGAFLAFANPNRSISVFDLNSGQELCNLLEEDILAVQVGTSMEPSVQSSAATYTKSSAQYIDVKRPRIKGLGPVLAMAFSLDRSRLTAAYRFSSGERFKNGLGVSEDETLLVRYTLRPEELIGEACGGLNRNLTQDEWHHYLGDEPYHKTCPDLR